MLLVLYVIMPFFVFVFTNLLFEHCQANNRSKIIHIFSLSSSQTQNLIQLNSCKVYQEATPRRSSLHGEPACYRQACAGINLLAAWGERIRLEVDSCCYNARELYQFYCH
jgi:hypothetical protein